MRPHHRMPLTIPEQILGRPLLIALTWLNVVLAAVASWFFGVAIFVQDIAATNLGHMVPVFIAIPLLWWAALPGLFSSWVTRKATMNDLAPAREKEPRGVVIAGSRRYSAVVVGTTAALTAFCIVVSTCVSGGWVVFWLVCAAFFGVAVVSGTISLAHPRRLVLHTNGVGSASFFSDAEVMWDDIASIEIAQGMANLIVIRLNVHPGAPSFERVWRHPFMRPPFVWSRNHIDIEPLTLGVDGAALLELLWTYWRDAGQRRGISVDTVARGLGLVKW